MSLYNKYRPSTWDEFLGMGKEVTILQKHFEKPEHNHNFLFTGPAGCGKTTMARMVASHLGAEIVEMNTADDRGIDTARSIIEATAYKSLCPVAYILDEVHKTSNDFQNAMLKVLEDTPESTYFILCSSEPTKIITAVKSRCTKIDFKPLSNNDILRLCKKVAKAEGVKVELEVLERIADVAGGSPREALVALEAVLTMPVDEALVYVTEKAQPTAVVDVCRAILNWDWSSVAEIIQRLESNDWEGMRYAVLGYMTAVLLKSNKTTAYAALEEFSEPFYNSGKAGFVRACYATIAKSRGR